MSDEIAELVTVQKEVVKDQRGQEMIVVAAKRKLSPSLGSDILSISKKTRIFHTAAAETGLASPTKNPTNADLLHLENESIGPSWLTHLQSEISKPKFIALKKTLWTEGVYNSAVGPPKSAEVFPPAADIYSWSRFTALEKVKVVILGQDPYHNVGQAHGLAFSVQPGVAVPPSLKNIYGEVKNDYPSFKIPKHGYLGSWAEQGVLCLNTCLTVRAHKANSHSKKGWEEFTDAVLKLVDQYGGRGLAADPSDPGGVVVLAWGTPAAKRIAGLDKSKHLILTSVHPSPLSAARGFFGNQHFKKANEWLEAKYGREAAIDWTRLDLPST